MDNEKEKTYISTNLKYLRNLNNKSLNDVANICDKSDVAIHYWENGTREPSAVDIAKLSNYFNVSVDDLLSKDLRFEENSFDELEVLFDKHKDILTEDDKEYIKFIIEKRKKEIDKELGED